MPDPRDRHWNKELEGGLPDSRLSGMSRERKKVFYEGKWWERVFCANCGRPYGAVTEDWAYHVFWICDGCERKSGRPPGCVEAPVPAGSRRTT